MSQHANGWRRHGNRGHGIEFVGTNGILQINRDGYEMFHEHARASRRPYYTEKMTGWRATGHHPNFFDCMRSRQQPAADAETGHRAAIYPHLANISYRVGRPIRWNAANEVITGDSEAAKLLTKAYRAPWHL